MNEEAKIIIKRLEYEEPEITQLFFHVSNGSFSAGTDIYCDVNDLKEIGKALSSFPKNIGDKYCYTYGSDKKEDNFNRLFRMKVYTTGEMGHCAIQFKIDLNQNEPDEGRCTLSLRAEPAAINRLGLLFTKFSELKHKELHWSHKEGALFDKINLRDE